MENYLTIMNLQAMQSVSTSWVASFIVSLLEHLAVIQSLLQRVVEVMATADLARSVSVLSKVV